MCFVREHSNQMLGPLNSKNVVYFSVGQTQKVIIIRSLAIVYLPREKFLLFLFFQGMASCHARIFLWSHADKVVISDIDGTITKSDVLGQILPAMGRDWSQTGVTGLFSKIKQNGYNFIYLSARAISQVWKITDSVKQNFYP